MIEPKPQGVSYNDAQWQAIQQTGTNLLVAASAGSGKTTVLIERILTHLKKQRANIDELLVVTFTEAAAKEMKERMEVALRQAIQESANASLTKVYLEQIERLPTAHIRTLHSFCLQIIQKYFFLIDCNPSFTLLNDETQKHLMYEEVWETVITEIMQENSPSISKEALFSLMSRYTSTKDDTRLFQLILQLYLFASSYPEPTVWIQQMAYYSQNFETFETSDLYKNHVLPQLLSGLMSTITQYQQALELVTTLPEQYTEKFYIILTDELNSVQQAYQSLQSNHLALFIQQLHQISYERWPTVRVKKEDKEGQDELKSIFESVKHHRDEAKKRIEKQIKVIFPLEYSQFETIEAEIVPIIEQLSALTLHFMQRLKEKKQSQNVLDYNDLEHMALDILAPYDITTQKRQASIAAREYQQLFYEVLVDEYQDINEIQAAILSWLSHESIPEVSGNMFMVGDVKQSIYGFRMAEPRLFMSKYQDYEKSEGGELIVLDQNYRSRDEVLQFTNFIFERIMDTPFGEMSYRKQESLKTGNHQFQPAMPHPDFDIEVLLHYNSESDEESNEEAVPFTGHEDSLTVQCHAIAQDICQKIDSGYQIFDKKLKTLRPMSHSDIVILASTSQPSLTLQEVFQQYGIAIHVQKADTYFQRHEIQLMIALLKLIDNPQQDIALTAILRSYFVGLTDDELSQIRIAYPDGMYHFAVHSYAKQKDDAIARKLQQFYTQLQHWQTLASTRRLAELIWHIYEETFFLDYVVGLSHGNQRQANLHALYEYAEQFEQSEYKGIFGFLHYIEQVMMTQKDLAEPLLLTTEQNAVRMMTVHASKGLEFPVVYVMSIEKKFNLSDISGNYILTKHSGFGTQLIDYHQRLKFPSLIQNAMRLEKQAALKSEEMRKLYVALTRCEQKLILVGKIDSPEKWQEELDEHFESHKNSGNHTNLVAPLFDRQTATSWLDWLQIALAVPQNHSLSVAQFNLEQVKVYFQSYNDIMTQKTKWLLPKNTSSTKEWRHHLYEVLNQPVLEELPHIAKITQFMEQQYQFELATHTASYQSVSELKRLYEEPDNEKLYYYQDRTSLIAQDALDIPKLPLQGIRYTNDTFNPPLFIKEKQHSATEIGTLTHFILQQLKFELCPQYTSLEKWLDDQLTSLIKIGQLTLEERQLVQEEKIINFLKSKWGQWMIEHSATLKKEQAFSYSVPTHVIFKKMLSDVSIQQMENDHLLIHGVIDVYFKTEEGLVLLDYKTDRYREGTYQTKEEQIELLAEKYRFQLSLYQKALSLGTNSPVTRVGLVLLDFETIYWYKDLYSFETIE